MCEHYVVCMVFHYAVICSSMHYTYIVGTIQKPTVSIFSTDINYSISITSNKVHPSEVKVLKADPFHTSTDAIF